MVGYAQMFDRVVRFLESKGVRATYEHGRPLSDRLIRSARKQLAIPLPESLVEVYREVGDGLTLAWNDGKPVAPTAAQKRMAARLGRQSGVAFEFPTLDDGKVFATFALPLLSKLVADHQDHARRIAVFDEPYPFAHVRDPSLAKQTAQRMRHWLGFHDEGNGDRICLDAAADPPSVVFDRHDWFDGGAGDNGTPMAPTLAAFLDGWSRVSFQFPRSLYWPSVLTGSGVNWDSDEFDRRFRLPS